MTASNFSVDDMRQATDHALPYTLLKDAAKRAEYRNLDAMAPAGAIDLECEETGALPGDAYADGQAR